MTLTVFVGVVALHYQHAVLMKCPNPHKQCVYSLPVLLYATCKYSSATNSYLHTAVRIY